jgi:hypothetical protein
MTIHPLRPCTAPALAAALACAAVGAQAESIASSAASSASLTASSASQSLDSSRASSPRGGGTAGDYRIEAVTAAADRPGHVRLALQPLGGADNDPRGALVLTLPQPTAQAQGLARGDVIRARARAYGIEFARADTRQAFFLVLDAAWQRELDPRPVAAAAASL